MLGAERGTNAGSPVGLNCSATRYCILNYVRDEKLQSRHSPSGMFAFRTRSSWSTPFYRTARQLLPSSRHSTRRKHSPVGGFGS